VPQRPAKLVDILLRRDIALVPAFCEALAETDQKHVARLLGFEGFRAFIMINLRLYIDILNNAMFSSKDYKLSA